MEIFHIWDLDRVNIRLDYNFLKKVNILLIKKFKFKREAWKLIFPCGDIPFGSFKNSLKESSYKKFFFPLDVWLRIIDFLKIPRDEFEKSITSYKTAGGVNYIESPILPIVINPIFHMIFAHNIGDGTVINPKKGRLPYFGYRQFDEFYRLAYVKKLEYIFGKIKYQKEYFIKSTRPYCPAMISSLFFKYYKFSIEDFLSDRARITGPLLNSDKDSLLAVLIAFIIDEGYIDSTQISICLKNKLLINDLKQICDKLNYESKITEPISEISKHYARLHILRRGMKKLFEDYIHLNERYPIINLGKKGKKIEDSFKIYNRKIIKKKGNQDNILSILIEEQLSVNQIAERIGMTRQGVRFHIHNLIKQNKIELIDKNKLNWEYKAC